MCLTEPVRVLTVDGALATVEANGKRRSVSTLAVPEVRAGDWAILAAGLLVRVLEPDAAARITAALHLATHDRPPKGELA
jgi:hydrogenase assembly chaperone HypC/HupF